MFGSAIEDFYLTNPIARASVIMAECSVLAEGRSAPHRGGVADMAELWTDYIWPLLIIVAQSVLLLVLLLIVTAYVLYADRKIWAAVQIRRGPNVVGPWGLLQSFADLLKFIVKEPIIPAGANKGVFLLAPLVTAVLALSAWAVIPVNAEWAIADLNIGVLYIFAISSLMVYGVIMAGWSSNSKYPFLVVAALGGADGVLRSLHRFRHHHRPAVRRLARICPRSSRRRTAIGECSTGIGCRCFRCS